MTCRRALQPRAPWATLAALAALLFLGPAAAQPPPAAAEPAPAATPAQSARDAAKERFDRGRELFQQQSYAAALAELQESRRLYPTWSATSHAAACLARLDRFDESLDMYATLLRDFGDKLPPGAKESALRKVDEMRKLVGTIEIEGAIPGAAIVVNGEARGDYPLLAPLRVPAGSHIVRVYKEGHEPFERRLEVAGGTTARVTAPLRKLRETGTLQVVEARGRALEVVVDGVTVGKTGEAPLDVPLAPGKRVVFLRGEGNLGTAPATVTLRANEVSPLRVESEELTASLRITPTPFDALVALDSVTVGRGLWDGRVRPGAHTIEVAAEGFRPEARAVTLQSGEREAVSIELERDPRSPFWRAPPPPPRFVAELDTAVMLVPSFGGDVAGSCLQECSQSIGVGTYGAIRGGYALSSGLEFGLMAGYLTASQSITGRQTSLNVVGLGAAEGKVDDVLRLGGVLVGAWAGYSVDASVPLLFRLSAGALLGAASDARLGAFRGGSYRIGSAVEEHAANFVYATPEVRVRLPLRRGVELHLGLEVPILFGLSRPAWSGEGHAINAGPDGYGWFNEEAFLSGVLVSFAPGVGATFDL